LIETVGRAAGLAGARTAPRRIGRAHEAHSVSASRAAPASTAIGAPQFAHGFVWAAVLRDEVNAYIEFLRLF
jgi:hypothetical protein